MSKTICEYPFTSIAVRDYTSDGKLRSFWPCCMMGNLTLDDIAKNRSFADIKRLAIPYSPAELTPEEIFNHPAMERLRQNLIHGVRDRACNGCWEQEDRGIKSFRQIKTENKTVEEIVQNKQLRVIDMSISNACNLRCRMCHPAASNALMIDYRFFEQNGLLDKVGESAQRWALSHYKTYKLSDVKQWQWLTENTDKFDELRLSGGEPFYNPTVLDFLDKAIADGTAKNIKLAFHTNATLFTDEILDKLEHFKTEFNFSIDGCGKPYNLIRYPATWEELDTSVRRFIDRIKPEMVHFNFVMMIPNIFNLPDFVRWVASLNINNSISFAEVHWQTRGISLRHLSIELLKEAYTEIEAIANEHKDLTTGNALNIIRDAIDNNLGEKDKTLQELEMFDLARKQNFRDFVDPRITKWLDN